MTPKKVLSIGRQFGSGGRVLGRTIADKLGMKYYDEELLSYAAQHSGIDKKLFAEKDEKPVSSSFFQNINHLIAGNNSLISDENIFKEQSDAIRKAAVESDCVIIGRCSDYILRDYEYCMSIFYWAPIDDRIERVSKRRGIDDREKVRLMIEREDSRRAKYYNYFTGKTWGAAQSYDACMNVSLFGIEGTADMTIELMKKKWSL
ncbi:MAG: cytidylate kinase-like family protein [Bacteroidales bacterium]|nr:cytidylate kinase-like family protein [Bacteroidales bacterium]